MKNTIARTLTALGASALFILSASPLTACAAGNVTMPQAKQIALKHAGYTDADVTSSLVKQDIEDGVEVYEVDFTVNGAAYDYDIRTTDGAILHIDIDFTQPVAQA